MDLAARLLMRGHQIGEMTSFLHQEPRDLRPEEGSGKVRAQMQAFAEVLLRQRTLAEVREVCRLCGLPANGPKDELVRSILAYSRSRCSDADPNQDVSEYLGHALCAIPAEPMIQRRRRSSSSSSGKVWMSRAIDGCGRPSGSQRRRRRSNCKVSEEEWLRRSSQAPTREYPPQRRRSNAKLVQEACTHPLAAATASEWTPQKRRRCVSKRSDEVLLSMSATPATPPSAATVSLSSTPAKPCRSRSNPVFESAPRHKLDTRWM